MEPLVPGSHFAGVASVLEGIWNNPHVYYVLFLVFQTGVLAASCGTKLHCVSAFGSALKVVRTTGRCTGLVSVALGQCGRWFSTTGSLSARGHRHQAAWRVDEGRLCVCRGFGMCVHTGELPLHGSTSCCTAVLPCGGVEGVSCLFAARETLVVLGALHTGAGRGVLVHRDMTPTIRCILACVCVCSMSRPNHHRHTHLLLSPILPPLPPHHHHHHTLSPSPLPSPPPTHTTHTIHHTPHTTTTTHGVSLRVSSVLHHSEETFFLWRRAEGGRGAEHVTYDARVQKAPPSAWRMPRRRDRLWLAARSTVGRPWPCRSWEAGRRVGSALSFLTAQAPQVKGEEEEEKEKVEQEVLARFGRKYRPKGLRVVLHPAREEEQEEEEEAAPSSFFSCVWVSPEKHLDSSGQRRPDSPHSARCLVQQWLHVHASVSLVFSLCALAFWTPLHESCCLRSSRKLHFSGSSTPGTPSVFWTPRVNSRYSSYGSLRRLLFFAHSFHVPFASSSHLRVYRVQGVQENRWPSACFFYVPLVSGSHLSGVCIARGAQKNGFLCHAHASVYAGLGNLTRILRAGGPFPHGCSHLEILTFFASPLLLAVFVRCLRLKSTGN